MKKFGRQTPNGKPLAHPVRAGWPVGSAASAWSHRCDEVADPGLGRPDPGPDRLQLSTAQFHHMVSRKEVGHRYCCGAASAAAVGGITVFRTRRCDPVAGDRKQRSGPPCSCGGWGSTGSAPVKSVDGVLPLLGPGAVGYAPGPPFILGGGFLADEGPASAGKFDDVHYPAYSMGAA